MSSLMLAQYRFAQSFSSFSKKEKKNYKKKRKKKGVTFIKDTFIKVSHVRFSGQFLLETSSCEHVCKVE